MKLLVVYWLEMLYGPPLFWFPSLPCSNTAGCFVELIQDVVGGNPEVLLTTPKKIIARFQKLTQLFHKSEVRETESMMKWEG